MKLLEKIKAGAVWLYCMKLKFSGSLAKKLIIFALVVGLSATTKLFSNFFMMLVDRGNFIPEESSIFSFEPYGINQGSSNYWIYGEDGDNYYYFSYESPVSYIAIPKSTTCQGFDRQDYTTWCSVKDGGEQLSIPSAGTR